MDHDQGRSGRTAGEAAITPYRWLATAAALFCAAAFAQDEHPRRLGAELAVMAGDVRRLARDDGGPLERQGLALRLSGALSSLPLLMRRADADADASSVGTLRIAVRRGDWRAAAVLLERLRRRYPFDAGPMLAGRAEPKLIAIGSAIHSETCAGCHDVPWGDSLLPARNLSGQMASMAREEFAARLWLGVRGTRETAYGNPFSDDELAALIAFYSSRR